MADSGAHPGRPYSLSAEAMALRMAAEGKSVQLRRELGRIFTLTRSYRKLFFDKDGQLKPEGRAVLEDLIQQGGLGLAHHVADHAALAQAEGQRRIVLHIFARFRHPEGKIAELERQLARIHEQEEDDE